MKLYLLSGLGADERVFTYLNLNGIETKNIRWIPPEKDEPISQYTYRLLDQIEEKVSINLLGVSFGGIIAQGLAQYVDCQKLFLISSVKHPSEMSFFLQLLRKTRLHKLVHPKILNWTKGLGVQYFFGLQTQEERQLMRAIIKDTNNQFLNWAIDQVMQWKGVKRPPEVIPLHGTADRIFPIRRIKQCISILGGSHFMIVNKAGEISEIIRKELLNSEVSQTSEV